MTKLDDAKRRSAVIAERIRQRTDLKLREAVRDFERDLSFELIADYAISEEAWNHVTASGFDPKLVFAHPTLLRQLPRASEYYRGIALLSRKRVAEIASSVEPWENKARTPTVTEGRAARVAQLYNAVISSIIEGINRMDSRERI